MLELWTRNAWLLWRRRDLPLEWRQQGLLCLGFMANLAALVSGGLKGLIAK